ncbi:accessory gene regulator B family protein [Enterococcus thailandicus]|uniref:accessory gene regulator B family protein n=1 Tax=Enterococcus TaxID=1350 RepID=UPI00094DDA3D|nr:accessory gene regulator B family protein [Enterococcus thailandicus]
MVNYIAQKIFLISVDDNDERSIYTRYYIECYLVGLQKLCEIIILAALFKTFKETIIVGFLMTVTRKYSKGWHSKSKLGCSVLNALFYVVIPYFIGKMNFQISYFALAIIGIVVLLLTAIYAPQFNAAEMKTTKEKNLNTKVKAISVNLGIFIISIFCPNEIQNLLVYTLVLQSLMIYPPLKKFITGDAYK